MKITIPDEADKESDHNMDNHHYQANHHHPNDHVMNTDVAHDQAHYGFD